MRKFIAILTAGIIKRFIQISRRGSGSALPGLVAQRIDPLIIPKLAGLLTKGIILVTGTNGKTTTAKMIYSILKQSGFKVVYNSYGSNLSRGLASMLIQHTNIWGTTMDGEIGLFEVDEAVMPEIVGKLNPTVIVVTNLFRDQLDRYGEVDKTAKIIGSALKYSFKAKIILNADDPLVVSLSSYNRNILYFGINANYTTLSQAAIDSHHCMTCKSELIYSPRYFSHLGNYHCPLCNKGRPELQFTLNNISMTLNGSSGTFISANESENIKIKLPGFYNLYNALAAASVAEYLHTPKRVIGQALSEVSAAFGRMEKISLPDNKNIVLILVKNPTSFAQTLETLTYDNKTKNLLILLNDNLADGTDISWIWDVDFKIIRNLAKRIVVSGIRAEDMQLRLKYAGFPKEMLSRENLIQPALMDSISKLDNEETLYVFTTYTAMLQIRRILSGKALVKGAIE